MEAKEALADYMRIAPSKGSHLVWDKDGFFLGIEKDGIQNPLWEKISEGRIFLLSLRLIYLSKYFSKCQRKQNCT